MKLFSNNQIKCGVVITRDIKIDKRYPFKDFRYFLKFEIKKINNAIRIQINKYFDKKPKAEKKPNRTQSIFLLEFKLFQKKYTDSAQKGNWLTFTLNSGDVKL